MRARGKQPIIPRISAALFAAFYGVCGIPGANGYAFNRIVPDVRQPASPEVPRARLLRTRLPLPARLGSNGAPCWERIQ
jgi:hypothetical protein